jgi:hypothetical protein
MICQECGKPLEPGAIICKFCGTPAGYKIDRKDLNDRLKMIDNLVFGNIDDHHIFSQTTPNLEEIINRLEERLISKADHDKQDILDRIYKFEEEIQRRLPVRQSITDNIDKLDKFTSTTAVNFFLSLVPPQVNLTAFKIRSSIEKQLKDHFGYPTYKEIVNYKPIYYLVKSINAEGVPEKFTHASDRFNVATGNNSISKTISDNYQFLNYFVHEGEENNKKIEAKYPTENDQARFLKDFFLLLKQYNLIWE